MRMSGILSRKESRRPSLPTREARGFLAGLIVISGVVAGCSGGDDKADSTPAPSASAATSPSTTASASPTARPSASPGSSATAAVSITATGSATVAASATAATSPTTAVATATATTAAVATATTAPPTPTPVPPTATQPPPPPPPVTIALTDGPATFQFVPSNVTVPVGTTVTWVWGGEQFHDVTGPQFVSETKKSGTFSYTFTTAGTFNYSCQVHISSRPPMTGRIVVQ